MKTDVCTNQPYLKWLLFLEKERYSLKIVGCLSLVLWHTNHCKLFNAKFIFLHINSSISNNLV